MGCGSAGGAHGRVDRRTAACGIIDAGAVRHHWLHRELRRDDRYIVDYLVEEVLQRQPDTVRSFLRDTSILDRLSGPRCDAVTGEDSGKTMLEALARANLLVVPLEDR